MYTIAANPYIAATIARQQIAERVREADARRIARDVRRGANADPAPSSERRTWRVLTFRRAIA